MPDIKVLPSVKKEPSNQSGSQECPKSWRIWLRLPRVLQCTKSMSSAIDPIPDSSLAWKEQLQKRWSHTLKAYLQDMGFRKLPHWTMVHNFRQQHNYYWDFQFEHIMAYCTTLLKIGYSPNCWWAEHSQLHCPVLKSKGSQEYLIQFLCKKRPTAQVQTYEKLWQPPWHQRVVPDWSSEAQVSNQVD